MTKAGYEEVHFPFPATASAFLGDAETIAALIGAFCAMFEAELRAKDDDQKDADEFVFRARSLTRQYAAIFSGAHPGYQIVAGYHDLTVHQKLKADLGDFWVTRREAWDGDAICVLFEWLAVILAEKIKLAQGDEMLLEVMFKPSVQYAVKVLAGIEPRGE